MVEIHYRQAPQVEELFAQTLLSLPVDSWWEDWMRHADRVLDDPELVDIVYQALLKRRPKSRTRGRLSTPAEVVLRLLAPNTYATGAMAYWRGNCAPIWSIASSRA